MPDFRPQGIRDQLLPKCHVLYFPVQFIDVDQMDHRESGLVLTTVIEGLRERTEYIDIFLFSAHHSIVFCFRCSVYWWKGSVRF